MQHGVPVAEHHLLFSALLLVAGSVQADPPDAAPDAAASAIAAIRSDYDVVLKPGQAIVVDNPYGNVSARFGGFEHRAETHAVLQEPAAAKHIELEPGQDKAGRYSLSPRLPAGATLAQGQRLDLALFVPEGHALSVHTQQGQIEVHGVHSNVQLGSENGDIKLRGIKGVIEAETGEGSIEAALGTAPPRASQRLSTRTGEIRIGVDDHLDAALDMATSGLFATEYSIKVTHKPGEEPNKRAQAVIGEARSRLLIESKRGQISVFRRAKFTATGDQSSAAQDREDEQEDNDSD